MNPNRISKCRQYVAYALIACLQLQIVQPAFAQYAVTDVNPIQAIPPNIKSTSPRPMIMLNMSKDHQLFYRAYTEFADIDNDGKPDTVYKNSFNYTGYFDYAKCYTHNGSEFTPSRVMDTTTRLCNASGTNEWSGNFLNWSSMTRMDLVRKVLYGGKRSTDTATKTVLERAALPNDAHSFAKYYAGTADVPINKVTPFDTGEITLCNTTNGANTEYSHTSDAAPLIKVANGNYSLWNAGERWQCQWKEEMSLKTAGQSSGDNSNVTTTTGINASSDSPSTAVRLGGGNLIARIEVCKSSLIGKERCNQYGTNYKPIGLLHEYGENDSAEFGLITGSFSKNISGGVLRRNMGSFKAELDTSTGVFSAGVKGIVYTLDKLRVFGYRYTDGVYGNSEDGDCTFGLSGLKDNQCGSWGNPLGEMFVESLNYLANKGQSTGYISSATAQDPKGALMGLGVETWVDPMKRGATVDDKFGKPICRPLNILNFNASVISYDNDSITSPFAKLTSTTLNSQINAVGTGENINGKSWFIGSNGTTSNRLCNDKIISNLSDATGLCPDAAGYSGSFSLPGAAYWAHTNAIRTDITSTAVLKPFRVNTYGVALSSGKARIEIPISVSGATKTVVIQPAMRNSLSGGAGAGTLVDFRVVSISADRQQGKYLVIWEDSEQGGDYDQDMGGVLSYQVQPDGSVKVTTDVYSQSTGYQLGFGYVISGTAKDGVHFHSGINGFAYTDTTNIAVTSTAALGGIISADGGCSNCTTNDAATSVTYPLGLSTAGSLKDPLFYAAKWGGFDTATSNTISSTSQWDVKKKDGTTGSDDIPDNFFEVFKTDELEAALRAAFDKILTTSNSAPATSSSQLQTGGFKYVAKFDPDLKNGSLDAYKVLSNGNFSSAAEWRAQESITAKPFGLRNVITDNGTAGIEFNWGSLPAAYKTGLKSVASGLDDTGAEILVNYMRGERVNESLNKLRERKTNILGTIVNSTPWLQSPPTAKLVGTEFPGYAAFLRAQANRSKVIWVGSNDGMLHGFNASTGDILTSYAPGMLAPRFYENLRQEASLLTENDKYRAMVDGSPMTADIGFTTGSGLSVTTTWSTFLFSSLGRGGKGVFALNVTDPTQLGQSNAASTFKWKFTDSDMGYNINDPIVHPQSGQATPVAKMNNGKFALLQPNGVKSPTGKSKIYVLYADGPDSTTGSWTGRYDTLDTESTGTLNISGMSGVNWVDTDSNGTADIIYGTDVDGRLWKFDVSSANPTDWKSSYLNASKPVPLYTAKNDASVALPITTSPVFSFPPIGGIMLTFGTGKSIETGDFGPTTLKNRIYGIWDRPEFSLATGARSLPNGTSTFEPREFIRQVDQSVKLNTATTAAIDWTTRDGWIANFPTGGEMSVSNAELRGDTVYLIAIRPGLTDDCYGSPLTTLYLLDPLTGKASKSIVNPDNTVGIPVDDQKIRVVEDRTGKITDPVPCTKGDPGCKCVGEGVSETCTKAPPCTEAGAERGFGEKTDLSLCIKQKNARFQWREIPGLQTTTKP